MDKFDPFFEILNHYLETEIKPIANELDVDSQLLKNKYQQLVNLDCLKLLIPQDCGGLGGDRAEWIKYNIQLSRYSGALLFLQAQHQSAIVTLKKLLPNNQINIFFSRLIKNNEGLGIALAANRQILNIKKNAEGFIISGKLRWVTGYHFFDHILFSFDHDGKSYFTLLALTNNPTIEISQPQTTAVFKSTNTVSLLLNEFVVPFQSMITSIENTESKLTEHPVVYNFAGAAKALLEVAAQGKYFANPKSQQQYHNLLKKWERYYQEVLTNLSCPFKLRADGFKIAEKCASFARIVCGSSSVLDDHPINRINRELWQYLVAGYSSTQAEAYLD